MKLKAVLLSIVVASLLVLVGCSREAQVASHNLSYKADMFELDRRIVFYNGITNDYMLVIEGRCSIEKDNADKQLEVTCKIGDETFKNHFLGISDNVTYFIEQLQVAKVGVYRYKVSFRPSTILPDVDVIEPDTIVPDIKVRK